MFSIIIVSALEIFIAFIAKQKSHFKSQINFDRSPWFLVFILFTVGVSLKHLAGAYRDVPYQVPVAMNSIMDRELSFINSVLKGCNKRRKNLFFFVEPLMAGKNFYGYALPLLFTSALIAGGLSYGSASILICFMNIMATCFSIYNFSKKYTKWPTLASFLFLFSGSWAGFLYFKAANRLNPANDLVHQLSKTHVTCWYHPFSFLLSLSKSTSFSVAYAQYAIFWQPTLLSPVFAACCPSLVTSLATFGTLLGMPCNIKYLILCASTILFRLYPFNLMYKPLFREAEMRGTFFAPIVIWFNALGPIFPVIAIFFYLLPKGTFKSYFIAAVGPFLLLNFFREGTDHLQNACAIASTTFPIAVVAFTELMKRFVDWPQDEENKGIATFFMSATIAFLLFGGLISSRRIEGPKFTFFNDVDYEVVEWMKDIPSDAIIYGDSRPANPITLTGRQQFMGDKAELFSYGVNLKDRLALIQTLYDSNSTLWVKNGISYFLQDLNGGSTPPFDLDVVSFNSRYKLLKIVEDKENILK